MLVVTFLLEQYELEQVKIWDEALVHYLNTVDNKLTNIDIETLRGKGMRLAHRYLYVFCFRFLKNVLQISVGLI